MTYVSAALHILRVLGEDAVPPWREFVIARTAEPNVGGDGPAALGPSNNDARPTAHRGSGAQLLDVAAELLATSPTANDGTIARVLVQELKRPPRRLSNTADSHDAVDVEELHARQAALLKHIREPASAKLSMMSAMDVTRGSGQLSVGKRALGTAHTSPGS